MELHDAIRAAFSEHGLPQVEVIRRIRELPPEDLPPDPHDPAKRMSFTQTKLSKWVTGDDRPPLEALPVIERAAGRKRGWILIAAGYVEDAAPTVPDAAAMDPRLSPDKVSLLLTLYEALVQHGTEAAKQ